MYIRRTVSILGCALALAVCVFITYISRDVDAQTIFYNLGFLAVMLLMLLAASLTCLRRLMQVSRGLARGTAAVSEGAFSSLAAADGSTPLFENAFLDDCYRQYAHLSDSNPDASCDIRSFINEEAVETYVHRGILEMIPDLLTSLGILGTFVGLVMGLRSFDPSGYEQMAGSITPLINGIKVAFITSNYGIALSLAFSFNVRSELAALSARMDEFLDSYYLHVRPPYEVDSLARLLDGQKSREEMTRDLTAVFVEQMAKSFEQVITPAYQRMTDGIRQVVDSFTQSQAQVMSQICEAALQQMRAELGEDFARLGDTMASIEKAQSSCTDFIDRSVGRLQQSFASMQDHIAQMDQYSAHSFEQLSAAQQESLRINTDQKNAYQDYIRFMYQSIEQFSAVWEKNSEKLQQYSDEIGKLSPVRSGQEISDSLRSIQLQLRDIQKQQRAAMLSTDFDASEQDQSEMLGQALRKLDALIELSDTPRLFGRRRKK